VVDKDVTPSEDDKKKKDSSSTAKKGTTSSNRGSSRDTSQHTELTELSPSGEYASGKRKDVDRMHRIKRDAGSKKRVKRQMVDMNKKLKHLRKVQNKKHLKVNKGALKHPRSFSLNIMRILRSVNETQQDDALDPKRVNQLSMMIFDSFANDLCDKLIATSVELVKNTGKRQLGSTEVIAAMKLVLPNDMANCAAEAAQASLMSYKQSTKKFQSKIAQANKNKKIAAGNKKDD